jgi:hypothetical protein
MGRAGVTMRRRLAVFVLLTMLVQLLAPVGAFRAFAAAVSDPFDMATICSGMALPGDTSDTNTRHGANCCGYCSVGHGAPVALDPPPAIHVVLQQQYSLIAWLEAEHHVPSPRPGSHAQARAPPANS